MLVVPALLFKPCKLDLRLGHSSGIFNCPLVKDDDLRYAPAVSALETTRGGICKRMNRKNLEIQSAISSEFEAAPLQFDLEPIDSSVLSDSQVVNQIVFCRKLLFEILTC